VPECGELYVIANRTLIYEALELDRERHQSAHPRAYARPKEFAIISPDGRSSRVLSKERWRAYVWSKDPKAIYRLGSVNGRVALFSMDVRTGSERMLLTLGKELNVSRTEGLSIAPDGKRLLASVVNAKANIWLLEGFQERLSILQTPWRERVPD
jgi:Tol biopolymer transport system component